MMRHLWLQQQMLCMLFVCLGRVGSWVWPLRGLYSRMEAVVLHGGVVGPWRTGGKSVSWQGPSNCWVCDSSVPLLMQWMSAADYYAVGYTDSGSDLALVHSTISKTPETAVVRGWVVHNYSLGSLMLLTLGVWGYGLLVGRRVFWGAVADTCSYERCRPGACKHKMVVVAR